MLLYRRERAPGPQTRRDEMLVADSRTGRFDRLELTLFQCVNSTAERQLVGTNNTGKHSQQTAGNPPSNRVTEEVDLAAGLVLGPEAHTTEQERPLEGLGSVRVAASQRVVVVEHGTLELKVLPEERHRLGLALLTHQTGAIIREAIDGLGEPQVAGLEDVLVAVDFGLLEAPIGERSGVCPHGNTGRDVDKLDQAGKGAELLGRLAVLDLELEQSIIVALTLGQIGSHSGEFLVGRVVWGSDIVGEKVAVSADVEELNDISITDALGIVGNRLGRDDLPQVVGIVVRVTGHLLALAGNTAIIVAQRVLLPVAVEKGLGVLVAQSDAIVVLDTDGLGGHGIVAKSLLELGGHELITRSGPGEDSEVDLEPEEVEEEGNDDKGNQTSGKVLDPGVHIKSTLATVDIQQVPQVDQDGSTNGHEGEETNVLGRDDAAHAETSQEQPLPPLTAKWLVTQLIETDIAQNAESHRQHQGGVQEDQAVLANVSIVKHHQTSCQHTGWERISRLPHGQENNGNRQGTESGGHCAESKVRHIVVDVRVANVLEEEVTIVSDQPAHKGKQKLSEGRVHIEEVHALKVIGGKLATGQAHVSSIRSMEDPLWHCVAVQLSK